MRETLRHVPGLLLSADTTPEGLRSAIEALRRVAAAVSDEALRFVRERRPPDFASLTLAAKAIEQASRDGLFGTLILLPEPPPVPSFNFSFQFTDPSVHFLGRDLLQSAWAAVSARYSAWLPPRLCVDYANESTCGPLPWTGDEGDFVKVQWVCETLAAALEGASWPEPAASTPPGATVGLTLRAIRLEHPDLSRREVDSLRNRLSEYRRKQKAEFHSVGGDAGRPQYLYPRHLVVEFIAELRRKRLRRDAPKRQQ